MKTKELRDKTENELKTLLSQIRGKLQELRFQKSVGKLKNPRQIREIKKDIARILTLLKEKK